MEDLISKKDLLTQTGISYGQLYRWKRKGLIPEDWFVRRSTFTGQETFFPRDKMLARVERILSLKSEDVSLDDIAGTVAPDLSDVSLTRDQVAEKALVSATALEVFSGVHPDAEQLRWGELLSAYVVDELLKTGDVTLEEAKLVLGALEAGAGECDGRECDIVVVRKMGVATAFLISGASALVFEPGARVVARINLTNCIEALSARMHA